MKQTYSIKPKYGGCKCLFACLARGGKLLFYSSYMMSIYVFNAFSKFKTLHWKQSKFLLVPHYEVLLDETLSDGPHLQMTLAVGGILNSNAHLIL